MVHWTGGSHKTTSVGVCELPWDPTWTNNVGGTNEHASSEKPSAATNDVLAWPRRRRSGQITALLCLPDGCSFK